MVSLESTVSSLVLWTCQAAGGCTRMLSSAVVSPVLSQLWGTKILIWSKAKHWSAAIISLFALPPSAKSGVNGRKAMVLDSPWLVAVSPCKSNEDPQRPWSVRTCTGSSIHPCTSLALCVSSGLFAAPSVNACEKKRSDPPWSFYTFFNVAKHLV